MIFLVINLSDRLLKKWIIYHKDTKDTKKSDRLCILCVLCAFVVHNTFSKLGGDRRHQLNQTNHGQIRFFPWTQNLNFVKIPTPLYPVLPYIR